MIVTISAEDHVVVEDKEDLKTLSVHADGVSRDDVEHTLTTTGLGRLEDQYAWLVVDELRDHARIDDPEWEEAFDEMIDYARSQAWLDEPGKSVRAHLEFA